MQGSPTKSNEWCPCRWEEAWGEEPDARGNRGHCSPAGAVTRGLTDVTCITDRLVHSKKGG